MILELIGLLCIHRIIMLLTLILLELNIFQKKKKKFNDKFIVAANIFRIQAYDSIMCGYFCIRFIDFMLVGKTLTDFTNLFAPNNFKKNDNIILKYFMDV